MTAVRQSDVTPTGPAGWFGPPPTAVQTWRFLMAVLDSTSAAVGETPKDVVWRRGAAQLYHYRARRAPQRAVPLLLVHSLVSRPYILDLIPGNSFIEYLLDQGFDVFLTDWGAPGPEAASLDLADYVLDFLPAMLDTVLRRSGADAASMLGYCLGGVLTLLYAATHPSGPVRNLITLATPVDFDHLGLQAVWGRALNADHLAAAYGNIPAALIQQSFKLLKPASEFSPVRFLGLWRNLDDDRYVAQFRAFDRWTNDHVDFPGAAFRQVQCDLVRGNKLVRGGMVLRDRAADLASVRQSFLAIAAEADHIVPLAAATGQIDVVGGADKTMLTLPGGHVGLVAGRGARALLWPRIAEWLGARSAVAPLTDGGRQRAARHAIGARHRRSPRPA